MESTKNYSFLNSHYSLGRYDWQGAANSSCLAFCCNKRHRKVSAGQFPQYLMY